ncbi:MAG TPA: ABC transporter substrate-binding protein [Stellaceae bacterium]|nr:ABC transporter substrate-binding protein [Stellaceae bacterium]
MKHVRGLILPIVAAALIASPAARAAEPYEINTILSLSGYLAFVGGTQLKSLKAVEAYVNEHGGINGRPVSFVVADDGSSPQTAVQLAQGLIAKNVPLILGSSSPNACGAIAPLVAQRGPVLYCLANGGLAPPGGYEFLTLMSYDSQMAVAMRYFRERGLHRLATIFSTDAGGQDAERALKVALALPENKSIEFVSQQHFSPGDASTSAQMAVIKGANPDSMVAWATGGTAGTLFRGARDIGLDLPTVTSPGNLTGAFLKQYAPLLPPELIFPAVSYYGSGASTDAATQAAVATLTRSLTAGGAEPDMLTISAWDPAMLLVDAIKKLGTDVTAPKLHGYLVTLHGWTGVDGPYDFVANPQRGIGGKNVVMVRWDVAKAKAEAVSDYGGKPLGK